MSNTFHMLKNYIRFKIISQLFILKKFLSFLVLNVGKAQDKVCSTSTGRQPKSNPEKALCRDNNYA